MSEPTTSLYRSHRPKTFAEVVGQENVVKTLSNAISSDRVHHAYLFVGSRGTGKTSMAKILARSLNCANGPTTEPCGECESCVAIDRGNSMDVIEMDAASNRSVDDIRDLRDRVGYAPAQGHWKVYILDEAHMLTKEAWNAFLKTLEEPPPNTVFVLATTEPQKVMPTIADRCQRFDFQRPTPEQISEVIERVASSEGITIEPAATSLIARAAAGSFRDALGTLDQLVAFGGDSIEASAVADLLGAADADLIFDVCDSLAAGDAKGTLDAVERLAVSGRDPARFAADLVAHLRQLLVCKTTGGIPAAFTVTVNDPGRLMSQAETLGEAKLVGAIDLLSRAIGAMRAGDDPRFSLEIALLRIAEPRIDPSREALSRRIEELESRIGAAPTGSTPPPAPPGVPPSSEPEAGQESEASPESTPDQVEPGDLAEDSGSVEQDAEVTIERVRASWPQLVEHVRDSNSEMVSTLFQGAHPISVDAERAVITIGFPSESKFNKRKIEDDSNATAIAESIEAVFGTRLRPSFELVEDGDAPAAPEPDTPPPADEGEMVDLIKDTFDAEEVEEGSGDSDESDEAEEVG